MVTAGICVARHWQAALPGCCWDKWAPLLYCLCHLCQARVPERKFPISLASVVCLTLCRGEQAADCTRSECGSSKAKSRGLLQQEEEWLHPERLHWAWAELQWSHSAGGAENTPSTKIRPSLATESVVRRNPREGLTALLKDQISKAGFEMWGASEVSGYLHCPRVSDDKNLTQSQLPVTI